MLKDESVKDSESVQENVGIEKHVEKKELQGEIGDGKQLVDDVHEGVMRGCGHAESTSYSFRHEAAKRIHAVGTVSRTTQRLRHLRGTNEKKAGYTTTK